MCKILGKSDKFLFNFSNLLGHGVCRRVSSDWLVHQFVLSSC